MKDDKTLVELTAQITSAYLSNNQVNHTLVPELIKQVHNSLDGLSNDKPSALPAVNIEDSITDDYLICLEDGKKLKMLKRYLRSRYNLSPEDYREKWGLPSDYPMVAPNYAKVRSKHAKASGLGKNKAS